MLKSQRAYVDLTVGGAQVDVAKLENAHTFAIRGSDVAFTIQTLKTYGDKGNEGLVLWVGKLSAGTAQIVGVIVPPQHSIQEASGVGYFVDAETLFELNKFLASRDLRLLAQVHSHPGQAYHSDTDDRFAIVTTEGGLSLVVPHFGNAPPHPASWAVYRLNNGQWTHVPAEAAESLFTIT